MKSKQHFTIITILFYFICFSQEIPFIKVDKEKLGISSLKVDVEVFGNIATTTYDMLFFNPTNQILEGELNFPLGEGQNVVRLALEINGNLREAVVVEKELGRVAFEAVVRRGVDPVLLEKVTGNNYKARIYPIPANGYKRIVLAFDQVLQYKKDSQKLHLPINFNKLLDNFSINVEIFSQVNKPIVKSNSLQLAFLKTTLSYRSSFQKRNYLLNKDLDLLIPIQHKESIICNDNYFYLSQKLNLKEELRVTPKNIDLFWDASYSMNDRKNKKEIELLDLYFNSLQNINVNLIVFSDKILFKNNYQIKNGNWELLKSKLSKTVYDGATNYKTIEKIVTNSKNKTTLFFTDLMNNLDNSNLHFYDDVFVINSISKSNHDYAKKLTSNNEGAYINLNKIDNKEALHLLHYKKYKIISISTSNKETEIFPKKIKNISNEINISGKNYKVGQIIKIKIGYKNKVKQVIEYVVPNNKTTNSKLTKIFVNNKIKYLQLDKENNKKEIIHLSKTYNVISDFTSMIVLDDVRDYLKYNIKPPVDLLEVYNKLKNTKTNFNTTQIKDKEDRKAENIVEDIEGEFTITGVVSDDLGPVSDITVKVKGKERGTATDFDGNYSIKASIGDDLTFSHVSYTTIETTVVGRIINVTIPTSGNSLDEVIVTAQGIKKEKKALGYSVSTITSDENSEGQDLVSMLQGKVAGLAIIGNDTNSIRLRGNLKPPLFVVDGVPMQNINNLLDSNNIESITVIKGISGSILYGSMASNGVIVINTKTTSTHNNYSPTYYSNENVTNDSSSKGEDYNFKGKLAINIPVNNAIYLEPYKTLESQSDYYNLYLNQREKYSDYPAYLLDIYDLFKNKKYDDYANRILSNIIEITIDDYEKLKVYAYKLEKSNHNKLAVFIIRRILELRPEDSQSYRDLALVYQKVGKYKEAAKLLKYIVSGEIYNKIHRRNFNGVNQISETELIQIVNSNLNNNDQYKSYNKIKMYDLRVVIDWNHNDTDIDLHIIDPNREECFYNHNKTKIGGKISQDMTQGFGPEEFLLKNAKKGDYFVKVKYFGDRYQKIENPTFIKVTIFKNYGKKNQTEDIKVIRLSGKSENYILAKITI